MTLLLSCKHKLLEDVHSAVLISPLLTLLPNSFDVHQRERRTEASWNFMDYFVLQASENRAEGDDLQDEEHLKKYPSLQPTIAPCMVLFSTLVEYRFSNFHLGIHLFIIFPLIFSRFLTNGMT